MISDEGQEATCLCDLCKSEDATHIHSVDGGDPIAVCDHCCDRNCDQFNKAYWNSSRLNLDSNQKDEG